MWGMPQSPPCIRQCLHWLDQQSCNRGCHRSSSRLWVGKETFDQGIAKIRQLAAIRLALQNLLLLKLPQKVLYWGTPVGRCSTSWANIVPEGLLPGSKLFVVRFKMFNRTPPCSGCPIIALSVAKKRANSFTAVAHFQLASIAIDRFIDAQTIIWDNMLSFHTDFDVARDWSPTRIPSQYITRVPASLLHRLRVVCAFVKISFTPYRLVWHSFFAWPAWLTGIFAVHLLQTCSLYAPYRDVFLISIRNTGRP